MVLGDGFSFPARARECRNGTGIKETELESKKTVSERKRPEGKPISMVLGDGFSFPARARECRNGTGIKKRNWNQEDLI